MKEEVAWGQLQPIEGFRGTEIHEQERICFGVSIPYFILGMEGVVASANLERYH